MRSPATALDDLVRQIVDVVHPRRIVLFGSAARGTPRDDSDVDLLVVVNDGAHRRRTAQLLYEKVRGVSVPFDVVVATESDLRRHGSNPSLAYRSALEEGRSLYAAGAA